MKRILFIFISMQLIVVLNSSAFAEVAVVQSPTAILSGVLDGDRGSIQVMKELHKGKTKLHDEDYNYYRLSADVSFKILKQKTIFEQLPFKIDENLRSGKEYARFLFSGQNYTEQNNVNVKFLPDLQSPHGSHPIQQSTTLADYDELWVEYRDLIDDNPTQINYSLLLESEAGSYSTPEKLHYLIQNPNNTHTLVEVGVEDISKATWQPKDQLYLFKRVFGLEVDNNWRYIQEGGRVVLQRRFDRILSDNGSVDLVLDADTKLEWLNLRLKTEDGDEIIVEWESIPKQISKDDDDRLRIRMLLSELKKLHKQPVLEEMVVFLAGATDEIVENRPLLSLHWMDIEYESEAQDKSFEGGQSNQGLKDRADNKKKNEVIIVAHQVEEMGYGKKRLKLDLTKVLRQVDRNSKVASMVLSLEPELKKKLGGIEFSKIRLVSHYEEKVPVIAFKGRDLLKRWGLELDSIANSNESYVWPVIYKHSNINKKSTTIGLQCQCIDLEWKVGKEIIEGSYLYIGGKEIQDKVLGIQATPYSFSGESLGNWFLKLNESVQFDKFVGNHERVDYIKIRVYLDTPSGNKDKIKGLVTQKEIRSPVTELALFAVDNLSFGEILDATIPFNQETFLDLEIENKPYLEIQNKSSNIIINKAQDGPTTFIPLDDEPLHGDLFFNTVIDNRSEDDFLVVSYEVPWIYPLMDKCWLDMTATGDGKEMQDKFCLDGSSGKKSIHLPEWVDHIKWKATLPLENDMWSNSDRDKFYLSIKLLTTTTTIREQLVNQPVLTIDGNKLLPVDAKFNKYRGNLYFDLDDIKYGAYLNDIKHLEHPWWEVDKIIFDREEPFSLEEWKELNQVELIEGGDGLFWLQLLKYLSILLVIWWLLANGWFNKLFRVLTPSFLSLWNLPVRVLSRLNIEVSWGVAFLWWAIVTISLYVSGVLLSSTTQGENYYFTFGGMAVVMSWRALVEHCQLSVESRWPGLSKKVYSGAGTKYFSGFIVVLVGVAVMLILSLEPIAEQLAIISYYMLLVGVALEILDLRKGKPSNNQEASADWLDNWFK
jgi:hypothetical protein